VKAEGTVWAAGAYFGRLTARSISAVVFVRLLLPLPACCSAWSYPLLTLAVAGALLATAAMHVVTTPLVAGLIGKLQRPVRSREAVMLGLLTGSAGAESLWAISAYATGLARVFQTMAVGWALYAAVRVWQLLRRR